MSAMKAEDIYRRHVKALPPEERLRLVELIGHDLASPKAAVRHSVMELHGLGKEIWQGIDAQEYVDELRREWPGDPEV